MLTYPTKAPLDREFACAICTHINLQNLYEINCHAGWEVSYMRNNTTTVNAFNCDNDNMIEIRITRSIN